MSSSFLPPIVGFGSSRNINTSTTETPKAKLIQPIEEGVKNISLPILNHYGNSHATASNIDPSSLLTNSSRFLPPLNPTITAVSSPTKSDKSPGTDSTATASTACFSPPPLTIDTDCQDLIEDVPLYTKNAEDIRKTKKRLRKAPENYSYKIRNEKGETCTIKHILKEKTNERVDGRFSEVFKPMSGSRQIHHTVTNDQIVIKILKTNCLHGSKGGTAEDKINISIHQYETLKDYFEKRNVKAPIVEIYNPLQATTCGYTIVQKVTPLSSPPLSEITTAFLRENLTPQQQKDYDALVLLMEANLYLKENELSMMDLKWNNFGRDAGGNLVLLDYVNVPFDEILLENSVQQRLAGGNPYVEQALNKLISPEQFY